MDMKVLFRLLRMRQWYKNLVVFSPIFFGEHLFVAEKLAITFAAFIALCLVSSGNYIINDIVDRKRDAVHPEKRVRPIASGLVSPTSGLVYAVFLFGVGLLVGWLLGPWFFSGLLALIVLTSAYTLYLKHEVFVDILLISVNFVIRTAAVVFPLRISLSPWLILCPFFFALFLAAGKRHADVLLLKSEGASHKRVLQYYTPEITRVLMTITTTMLIVSYALYIFSLDNLLVFLTLPFVLYAVFRWYMHVFGGEDLSRHPECAIRDYRLIGAAVAVAVIFLIALY